MATAGVTTPAYLTRLQMMMGWLGRVIRQQPFEDLTFPVISLLFRIERLGRASPGELATGEGVKPSTLTRSLDTLQAKGLIVREREPSDRRLTWVELTKAGYEMGARIRHHRNLWLSERLELLSQADQDLIREALPAFERLTDVVPDGPSDRA
ncbi:MarR family winged helix-turn-helix transcriptional regulator [Prauserella cavernicola]|uniref:MarR family transcriptional regulator n=1 Tax=Prauserella cavernicola TaxID=2800127 RepID=A0A934QY78_9PSEU|nr:MarR family transcriptional regulator [Prauserella cavernicola]MBK1787469.1 MarR family transcriptional regulator [Prauserella cavernicola]